MAPNVEQKKIDPKEQILQDLNDLYQKAVADDNLAIALKVKELQGKCLGLFTPSKLLTEKISLADLSDQNLEELLAALEEGEPPPPA